MATTNNRPLVVVGSVNVDLVLPIARLPQPGETITSPVIETFPGGKGANQAAAAAKLGYPTYFLGQVGEDANTAFLKDALSSYGVNLEHLKLVKGPCGTAVILLHADGENSIIVVGGANKSGWSISEADEQLVRSAGALLLQREIPEEISIQVAQVAKEAGVPVVLDAGGAEGAVSSELLAALSVLSPNETELARLTGLPTDTREQVVEAAEKLMAQGAESVLVKLGAEGCLLIPGRGQEPIRQHALPAREVVDTTGAGDCFTGAYAVALLEGRPPQEALRFAAAAACICVQQKGAMTSMPSRQQVEQLLAQQRA